MEKKTSTERVRAFRKRKKANQPPKKAAKTSLERNRKFRAKQKALKGHFGHGQHSLSMTPNILISSIVSFGEDTVENFNAIDFGVASTSVNTHIIRDQRNEINEMRNRPTSGYTNLQLFQPAHQTRIHEKVNLIQTDVANYSITNMMEVKHSPAAQIDFRPTRNGLPEEEEEVLDTLFDKNVAKSMSPQSDECAAKATILNGVRKHPEAIKSAEIEDNMEIDLIKEEVSSSDNANSIKEEENVEVKNEKEEAEEANGDLDLFELDLDEEMVESTVKAESAETADASKVRDTGDDLDTLLSKINDLVEDCMEPMVEGAIAAATAALADVKKACVDEVVEIPDDDADDFTNDTTAKSIIAEIDADTMEESKKETTAGVGEVVADEAEEKVTVEAKEEVAASVEKMEMEIDDEQVDSSDDIVCLDSPITEGEKEPEDQTLIDEVLREVLEESDTEKENQTKVDKIPQNEEEPMKEDEIIDQSVENAEKPITGVSKPIEDDEIFLIEDDDDDDEPMKKVSSPAKVEEKLETSEGFRMAIEKEIEKVVESELEDDSKATEEDDSTKAPEGTPPLETANDVADSDKNGKDHDDDDDIVCLDDSFEETEEKEDTIKEDEIKKTEEVKIVEDKKKEEKDTEKIIEKVSEEVDEAVTEKSLTENSCEERGKETVEDVPKKVDMLDEEKVEPTSTLIDNKKKLSVPEKCSSPILDDEIVILDDDDDDDTSHATTEKKDVQISTIDTDTKSANSPVADKEEESKKIENSNMEDSKAEEDVTEENKLKGITTEEKISSSDEATIVKSSTILSDNSDNARDGVQEKEETANEAKAVNEIIAVPSETNSCSNSSNLLKETAKEDHDEHDRNSEQPPAKRIRLSQDAANSLNSIASQEDTKSNMLGDDEEMELSVKGDDEEGNSLKRVHSTESVSSDLKKLKTDEDFVILDEVQPKLIKKDVEVKPLPLYPPPKLEVPIINLNLDFLRRFKKSIHKMTKCDLEELVLQKIVEAIVHKSEFSEMRDTIEKQEKIISGHRTKITELNKQFRDLEMVHNRVLKDLETKNSQFIMPVKITRAVGLQVFFPNKKYDQPQMSPVPLSVQTSPAPISKSLTSVSNSPRERSTERVSSAAAVSSNVATPTTTNITPAVIVPQQEAAPRRGCVQKLTPMRPDTPRNSPLYRPLATGTVSSPTPSPVVAKDVSSNVKILNRTLAPKNRASSSPLTGNNILPHNPSPVVTQPAVVPASVVDKHSKTAAIPAGIATKKTNSVPHSSLFSTAYNKRYPKSCVSDPQSVAQPLPAAATVVTPQIPPSSTNTSVTVKPPSKSVIDLTDEDDVVPTPVANIPRTVAEVAAPSTPSPLVNQSAARRPYKVSVIPQQQLQQPKPNPPKQIPPRPQVPIAPKINGVNVPVRQIPSNPARYRHPAPLPNQPIHSSNPAWKLPPARPTIRISNLDSGIVISWTIEDTAKEKYAESTSYQIYAYQETSGPPLVESWRHVGDVKAMLLPMAVTLTQFQEGQRYYFAVRAVDSHSRCGPFSFAKTWS